MANDRLSEGAGRAGPSAEEAKRYYQERHGSNAGASGEARLRAETSHEGARTGDAPSGAMTTSSAAKSAGTTAGIVEASRDMSRGRPHPDPQYDEWREARITNTDRDYEAFRAQHRGDPAQAFGAWRSARQGGSKPGASGAQATAKAGDVRNPDRDLALGERPDQGSGGPHILDRSFGGTYDD